jgi:hypothetical protein
VDAGVDGDRAVAVAPADYVGTGLGREISIGNVRMQFVDSRALKQPDRGAVIAVLNDGAAGQSHEDSHPAYRCRLLQDSAFKVWTHMREVNGCHTRISWTFDALCPF